LTSIRVARSKNKKAKFGQRQFQKKAKFLNGKKTNEEQIFKEN
jgi:hypothetical protein